MRLRCVSRRTKSVSSAAGAVAILTWSLALAAGTRAATTEPATAPASLRWNDVFTQSPAWYTSEMAIAIGDNVLLWQRDVGGWNKISNMAAITEQGQADAKAQKADGVCTLDNGATHSQLRFLAKLYSAIKLDRFRDGFDRGLAYLFKAQYPSGGWPQYFPLRGGYHDHVTFNDGGMIGAINVLRDVARGQGDYAFTTAEQRQAAAAAVERATGCIVAAQIVINGRRTGWCAQHDKNTLAPAKARSYELPSVSGSDTTTITRFLMTIEKPSPEVKQAIESACAWLDSARITGKRLSDKASGRTMTDDPAAPPLWARFYDLDTGRPMYANRDGVKLLDYEQLQPGRRTAYQWLGDWPRSLLEKDLPAWRERVGGESKAVR